MIDIFKMTGIVAAIIVLIRMKVPLSLTLAGSALILGWIFHLPRAAMATAIVQTLVSRQNLELILILELVLLFSAILNHHGSMARAIAALNRVFRDARLTLALIPAVIGLLPVVGGAMLSAPLVAKAADELALSPERRTFLNYWFRHIWEYTMPTFAAVFLSAGIVGIPIAQLVRTNLALTLAAIATGLHFGFWKVRPGLPAEAGPGVAPWRDLLVFAWNLFPFALVIGLTLGFQINLMYSLAMVTAGTILLYRLPMKDLMRLGRQHLSIDLALLIWGMMLFKEMLMASQAMVAVTGELTRLGMPPVLLLVIVPAVIAFITGYSPAMVGLSFPVLLPVIQSSPSVATCTMLVLASGICAHMLSPMHACYVMTLQYNHASMARTYRLLLAPTLITFATGVLVFLLT